MQDLTDGAFLPLNIPDGISEELDQSDYGYSWRDLGPFTAPSKQPLFHAIHRKYNLTSVNENHQLVFNRPQCYELLEQFKAMQDLLLFLIYSVSAPPIHMTQYSELRISNGQRMRNFYKNHSADLLIIFNSKTSSQTGEDAFVCVFLLPRLGWAASYYCVIIWEFEELIMTHLYKLQEAELYREFLFVWFGKKMTTD
jgi:hypothetical protein